MTRRMRPFVINGKTVHEIGIPWHWGYNGLARGDVTNDISALVADPNVTIHEGKVFSGNIRPGRRSAPAPELFKKLLAEAEPLGETPARAQKVEEKEVDHG